MNIEDLNGESAEIVITEEVLNIEFYPPDEFGEYTTKELLIMCGLIPKFVCKVAHETDGKDLVKEMGQEYGFGELYRMKGGFIDENNIYKYDGDPNLKPLAKYTLGDKIILQYPYGIVAIEDIDNEFFITKMD